MNLDQFEKYFDDVILERGEHYFARGRVESIKEIDRNHYIVDIEGTDFYTVEIVMDETNNILEINCDCPYDRGDYCKHEAAALFALRIWKTEEKDKSKRTVSKKKIDLKTILSNQPKEELVHILIDFCSQKPEMEKRLLFKYTPAKDEVSSAKKLIKEYINKVKHRGFIEWNRVDEALTGVYIVLNNARKKVDEGDEEGAIFICFTVLAQVIDMLEYCDDSNGSVGTVTEECLDLIDEAAFASAQSFIADKDNDKLFSAILSEALNDRYNEWTDWRISLLKSCIHFCGNAILREKLETQLKSIIEKAENSSAWNEKYLMESGKLLQLEILERYAEKKEALQFIYENLSYSSFREKAIVFQMENKDFPEVVRLCTEGESADQGYQGLTLKWKKHRLTAYENLADKGNQQQLLLELLFQDRYEYYEKLKKLYPPKEWENVLDSILKTFEQKTYLPSAYVEILKEEHLSAKLLEYCQRNLSAIENLYPFLVNDYFLEVDQLFSKYIENAATLASDRKKYKDVCKIIKTYQKACGEDPARQIIHALKQKFNRRPAFMDELQKMEK